MPLVDPFRRTGRQQAGQRGEERRSFGRTRFFNQGRAPSQTPSTPGASSTVFARPPAPRPPVVAPPPAVTQPSPPVTLGGDTRFFRTPPAPIAVVPGTAGRVNPPAPVPANPFAAWGSQFDPSVNPTAFFGPTENLRTALQQSRHGFTNADRQFWQDFIRTVTTGHFGAEHERRVQRMMGTPAGWLKLAGEYMQTKGFYTPTTTTTTGTTTGGVAGGKPGTGGLGG